MLLNVRNKHGLLRIYNSVSLANCAKFNFFPKHSFNERTLKKTRIIANERRIDLICKKLTNLRIINLL